MTELLLKSVEAIDHELKKYFGMPDEEFEYFIGKFREDYFKGGENYQKNDRDDGLDDQNNDLKGESIKIKKKESNDKLDDILSDENETEENDIEYDSELETESIEGISDKENEISGENDDGEDDNDDYVRDTTVIHRYWLTRNDSDELVQLNKQEKKIFQQNRQ